MQPNNPDNQVKSSNTIKVNIVRHTEDRSQKIEQEMPRAVNIPQTPSVPADKNSKLSKILHYILVAAFILVPIFFLPTNYLSSDVAKSALIILAAALGSIVYALIALKEKKVVMPYMPLFVVMGLLVIEAVVSAFFSIHINKSLFGQGFETGTAGFLLALSLLAFLAFGDVSAKPSRIYKILKTLSWLFVAFFVFQMIRLTPLGASLSLGTLSSPVDTVLGKWPEFAMLGIIISFISASALMFLQPKAKAKWTYIVIGLLGLVSAFLVNYSIIWFGAALVFAILLLVSFLNKPKEGRGLKAFVRKISWLPLVLLVLAAVLVYKGQFIAGKVVEKAGTGYSELALPWQMTLDVVAGSLKNYPLLGVGPNHFNQAFMAYKPQGFNQTNAWSVEFNNGFGMIPSYFSTLGLLGMVLWILFYVFLARAMVLAMRKLPEDNSKRFALVSTALSCIFLWIIPLYYTPSHTMIFLAFVMTGVFLAVATDNGLLKRSEWAPGGSGLYIKIAMILLILVSLGGLVIYGKKTIALAYFAGGVKNISEKQDWTAADSSFRKALAFDPADVYWQALAENDRLKAANLVSKATSASDETVKAVSDTITDGINASRSAIAYDPSNYYNYLSEARVSQLAANIGMSNAYENAEKAYTNAITINPQNPSLYVSLAQLQAANKKLDKALETLGTALQVKNNYLDAVYLLSQVYAAQGNLANAITAAGLAINLNPQNPVLYFQLGLLEYNAQNFKVAVQAFTKAVELQPDYANAKYFLGLSAVRVGDPGLAVAQFEDLEKGNPDNQEVKTILNTLRAGKSPFALPEEAAKPEKRASLPVKEK